MQDNSELVVYQNNGCNIYECPRKRQYNNPIINEYDRIYRFEIKGKNQPTIEDICQLVYYILKNKVLEKPFYKYKMMVIDAVCSAEAERLNINNIPNKKMQTGMDSWM